MTWSVAEATRGREANAANDARDRGWPTQLVALAGVRPGIERDVAAQRLLALLAAELERGRFELGVPASELLDLVFGGRRRVWRGAVFADDAHQTLCQYSL